MTDPMPALAAGAARLCEDPAFREAVWRHLVHRRAESDFAALRTTIHPEDQMLRHSLRHWGEANRSVSQYYGVALQQHNAARSLFALAFPEGPGERAFLDFACGYGRLLRLLTHSLAPAQIWASEIQPDAVRHAEEAFGVHGLVSAYDPDQFRPGRSFDFIWVASLFSHLPGHLFRRWVERLVALLSPDGVLCFSVHGERLLPPGVAMPAEGIHFIPASEIEELDNRAYGTSFVTEDFVRAAVAPAARPGDRPCLRLAQALANEQDVYVVPRDPGRDLAPLASFRRGAWGWVDECEFTPGGVLRLAGWAASLDDGAAESVLVRVNGKPHACTTGLPREDVRAVLGDDRLARSGWELRCIPEAPRVFVEASARTAQGEAALLYAGWLGRA